MMGTLLASIGLLLAGCGDQLSGQAQKAVEEIKAEAAKAASKQIDDIKKDTVGQLKKMQGEPEKGKSEEKSEGKSDEKPKAGDKDGK